MLRALWTLTLALILAFVLAVPLGATPAAAGEHRLVIHVDENEADKMNLALNNAANVSQHYAEKGEDVSIEIVAYGPGLHMLRADTSPVKARIGAFAGSMPNVAFSACGNTMTGMEKKEGKAVELLPKITVVPAGVTRIMELQEQGWSYVKP